METITTAASTVANTVTKTIWGDNTSKEEPVSGKQGDTTKGEPFDAGNMDANPENKTAATTTTTDGSSDAHATAPSAQKDSSAMGGDSTKAQNDVRDPDTTDQRKDEAAKDVNDTEDGPAEVDVKGPGPKPIEQVAKEHGGDAGKSGENVSSSGGAGGAAPAADQDEDEDGPQKTSHGSGTGELYVKSSGLKADGGDFDATKPGAGREADRLLEEKGIHPGKPGDKPAEPAASSDGGKEKKSLGQKIKEKLHKN